MVNRREFLKSSVSAFFISFLLPYYKYILLEPSIYDQGTENSSPDFSLTQEEKVRIEQEWAKLENVFDFPDLGAYFAKQTALLNLTRARDLDEETFIQYLSYHLDTKVSIGDGALSIITEIKQNIVPPLAKARTLALGGIIPPELYGYYANVYFQTLLLSYYIDHQEFETSDPTNSPYGTYRDMLAFVNLIPPDFKEALVSTDTSPSWVEKLSYLVAIKNHKFSAPLEHPIFTSDQINPVAGITKRRLDNPRECKLGDIVVWRTQDSPYPHLATVVHTTINNPNEIPIIDDRIVIDPNADNRLLCTKLSTKKPSPLYGPAHIIRTDHADNVHYLNNAHKRYLLSSDQIPASIFGQPPHLIPNFSQIPEISRLWGKLASDKITERADAIARIIHLLGMQYLATTPNGTETRWNPTWDPLNWGGPYWQCSLYPPWLLHAFGINSLTHYYLDGLPSPGNYGQEYGAEQMHDFLNNYGRQFGFIDATFITLNERIKMLKEGYIFVLSTNAHMAVIVPQIDDLGRLIPAMSQAGYNFPLHAVNSPYKFLDPTQAITYGWRTSRWNGTLFAIKLPGFSPEDDHRQRLFGHYTNKATTPEQNLKNGIVTNIKDIQSALNLSPPQNRLTDFFTNILGQEIIGESNHDYFNYVFNLVSLIQNYPLPIGHQIDQDPDLFCDYLTRRLKETGYAKTTRHKHFQGVINLIRQWFKTRELVNRNQLSTLEPIQCVGFVELCMLYSSWGEQNPPEIFGIVGDAADIAKYYLNQAYSKLAKQENTQKIAINKKTKAVVFPNDIPATLEDFSQGDVFFIAYNATGQQYGHTGTIVTNPFTDKDGNILIGVADANRFVTQNQDGTYTISSDGMPRIRFLNFEEFKQQFLIDIRGKVNSRMIILRSR